MHPSRPVSHLLFTENQSDVQMRILAWGGESEWLLIIHFSYQG